MQEEVYFDLLGDRRLIFFADGVTYRTDEIYLVLPLPFVGLGISAVTNRPILFNQIRWIGTVRKRQTWALVLGLICSPLWLWCAGAGASGGIWGMAIFGVIWFIVMGLFPLWMYWRGRPFLVIASDKEVICIPQDRNMAAVNRAITLLRAFVNGDHVQWEIK